MLRLPRTGSMHLCIVCISDGLLRPPFTVSWLVGPVLPSYSPAPGYQ